MLRYSLLLLALLPGFALAGDFCSAPPRSYGSVGKFTFYKPAQGGINGRCGTSASGLNACNFTIEDHLDNGGPGVMAAVPQQGGNSSFFGGIYRLNALETRLGKNCVVALVGDRYGAGSNDMSKMDIVVKPDSKYGPKFNGMSGQVTLVGRLTELRNRSRTIRRQMGAQ